jgi:uncharacterized protein
MQGAIIRDMQLILHPPTHSNKAMKLHQDTPSATNVITGYGADYVEINQVRHDASLILAPDLPPQAWPVTTFDELKPEHFDWLLTHVSLPLELLVFGSGQRLRFLSPQITAALADRQIGIETMDFQAACRTYNILLAEGRRVAAALLIEHPTQS